MVKVEEDTVGPDAPVSSSNPSADDDNDDAVKAPQDGAVKDIDSVQVQVKTDPAAATTNGDAPTNGAPAAPIVVVVKTEDTKPTSSEYDDEDDDDDNAKSPDDGEDEEEEKLFEKLEHDQEEEEAAHPHEQPKDVTAAPRLLQSAFQKGEVAPEDDSESDSEKKSAAAEAAVPSPDHHLHARASQLDFLLSKASEYSNFISKDLEDLQAAMAETAKKKLERAEKRGKKRKGDEKATPSSTKKKTKKNSGEELKSAFVKDAAVRAANKAIFVQPPNLAEDCFLKDYQLEGVRWLASLFENGVSGILADEMGLGKTIQVIGLIAHLLIQGVSGPFLIVAPLATLPNWVREFEKWLPSQPVVRYHGTGVEREAMMKNELNPKNRRNKDFPFIVTSFETAIRDQNKLAKLADFAYVIVDEGHRLKNHRCMLIRSLKQLNAHNRLLLTGTPIQNTLDELWSLLNFVNPQIFDDLTVFQSWFGFKNIGEKGRGSSAEDIIVEERKNQTVTKLHEILRPFLLRRIKTDVLSEMPPKKEIVVYSGMSKLQLGYADLIDKGTLRDELMRQGIEMGRTLSQTNKMMNHRKNVNHPFMFGEPMDPTAGVHIGTSHPQLLVRASGKFALLDRMLTRLHKDGHQVLIFSQMTKVLNIIEDYLAFRNWNYCRIDGSTNIDDRQKAMDVFNAEKTAGVNGSINQRDDRYFVFMLSTRAGGLGINLTSADTCIIFDSDWNPHADSQAMDRCHRLGQTRPVAVYRLLTCNSVDIEMMEKQISKKKLERMTIAGGDFRKAGRRSQGDITFEKLQSLLVSDIKDMQAKGDDVEDLKLCDEEFELIMDRKLLFGQGKEAIPGEGKMYDVIDAAGGDFLGAMKI